MSNVFSFIGTCGCDSEVRYLPSGQAVLNVNVANNIGFGDKQQTVWLRVALWGRRAEGTLKDYLKKGQQVFVSGELSVNEYTKKDGTKGFQLEVNADILDLVGKKSDNQQAAYESYQQDPYPPAAYQQPPAPQYQPPPQAQHQRPPQQNGAAYQAARNGTPQNYDDDIPY